MAGQHNYPFKKGVDITAWVLQIAASIVLLGISADAIVILDEAETLNPTAAMTEATVFITFSVLTILFDIIEITLIARNSMAPALYLSFACIKTLIWLIILVIEAITIAVLGAILAAVLLATSIVQLVQGARIVHRKREGTLTGGQYAPALNLAMPGNIESGVGAPRPYGGNNEYQSPELPTDDFYRSRELSAGGGYKSSELPASDNYKSSELPASSDFYQANEYQGHGYPPTVHELASR
ncbi:hypothetical protein F4861DRAFT_435020 [Xylaria intraflava]|nr:hypothetical protein F4861DRAFT_435020 [Xylaria intraflava]